MEQDETQVVQPEEMDTVEVELEAQEPDWRAEALKYKAMAQRYKERVVEKPEQPPKERPVAQGYDLNDEVVDLRLDGYSKSEVEFIMKNGGRKALEDSASYVSIAVNTRREQDRAEANASKVSSKSGMSEVERKYTPEQLKNMPLAELEKLVPKA